MKESTIEEVLCISLSHTHTEYCSVHRGKEANQLWEKEKKNLKTRQQMCLQVTATWLKSNRRNYSQLTQDREGNNIIIYSHSRYCMNTNYILKGVSSVELILCQSGNKVQSKSVNLSHPHTPLWHLAAFVHCLKRMTLVSSVFADDLSRNLCCGIALPGGACVFWCKRARRHDQWVDMIIVGSHVLHVILKLKCLEQHGQEHQEFLIFLAQCYTGSAVWHAQGKTKSKTLYII